MRKIFLVAAIILAIALIGGTLYWYFVLSTKPASEITSDTKTKPSPGVGFGSLRPYADLCKEFQKVDYKISCEKAVSLALQKAQGQVQKVSIGSVRSVIPDSNPPKRVDVEMWLVDIKVNPYFDEHFRKEIQYLRIGIEVNGNAPVYKKIIK